VTATLCVTAATLQLVIFLLKEAKLGHGHSSVPAEQFQESSMVDSKNPLTLERNYTHPLGTLEISVEEILGTSHEETNFFENIADCFSEDMVNIDLSDERLDDSKANAVLEQLISRKKSPEVFDVEVAKLIEMKTIAHLRSKVTQGSLKPEGIVQEDPQTIEKTFREHASQWQEEADSKRIHQLSLEINLFDRFLKSSKTVREYWNEHLSNAIERGIVMSAGGSTALVNAFVTIRILRSVGCSLPVALFHYGEEELSNATRTFFQQNFSRIHFVDLEKSGNLPIWHAHLESHLGRRELGYMIKVASIYKAPFRHALFIDSDAIPMQDPSSLFNSTNYHKFGNIFFNDFWQDPVTLWRKLKIKEDPWHGIDPDISNLQPDERGALPYQSESGMVAIDLVRHWKVLEWLLFLNTQDTVYRFVLGDKDTFRLSFFLAGNLGNFYTSPLPPALPLTQIADFAEQPFKDEDGYDTIRFRCLGMLQLHPENGLALFHHRTADAKLRPRAFGQEIFRKPITHVTPPITSDQASLMNFGSTGFSIYKGGDHIAWGLSNKSSLVRSNDHDCFLNRLDDLNRRCAGLNDSNVFHNPSPVLVVEIPEEHAIWQVSSMEIESVQMIPFIEPK
jgi:hypothetical protein